MTITPNTGALYGLDWLESRNGCTRYAIPVAPGEDSESLWVCDDCEQPADPDEGGCIDCHPENFEDEEADEEECQDGGDHPPLMWTLPPAQNRGLFRR